jgi:hypothetical protein
MLLNEPFDLRPPESRNLAEANARQEWLLSGDVIIHPSLADPQPFCDIVDGQQTIRISAVRPSWGTALKASIQAIGWRCCWTDG